jgi:hypothetical protein
MQLEWLIEYLKTIDWWGYLKGAIDQLAGMIGDGLETALGRTPPTWLAQELAATLILTVIFILVSVSKQVVKTVVIILWIIAIIGVISLLMG